MVNLPQRILFIDTTKTLYSPSSATSANAELAEAASETASIISSISRSSRASNHPQTSLPFAFKLPASANLPPSFSASNGVAEGSISYYLVAKLSRKSWMHRQAKNTFVFPFLPADKPTAQAAEALPGVLSGSEWTGAWTSVSGGEKLKKGVFGSSGSSTVEVR